MYDTLYFYAQFSRPVRWHDAILRVWGDTSAANEFAPYESPTRIWNPYQRKFRRGGIFNHHNLDEATVGSLVGGGMRRPEYIPDDDERAVLDEFHHQNDLEEVTEPVLEEECRANQSLVHGERE